MAISEHDVTRAYETILRRPPESSDVIAQAIGHAPDIWALVQILLGSAEYRSSVDTFGGYNNDDMRLLHRFSVASQGKSGFVTDFVGTRTDVRFNSALAHLSGHVEGLPIPSSFHADAVEWVGTLLAVEESGEEFAVAEIGAGWGPWIAAGGAAARRLGKSVFLVGVEADPGHARFMEEHLANNGFEPDCYQLFGGAIGPGDGFAFFPRIQSEADWGAAAVFQPDEEPPSVDYRGHALEFDRVEAFSMETVLSGRPRFDLVHIDIQGTERDLIPAARQVLTSKVKRIVLGTHARAIEGLMIEALGGDWVLEREKPCRFLAGADAIGPGQTLVDGSQVWRNRHL